MRRRAAVKKNLTRRANHRHIDSIARSEARAGNPGAGFFASADVFLRPWCRRIFRVSWAPSFARELVMRIFLIGTLIAGSLISFEAKAQERAGDAALGAVSGAVVLGPIGAVAGAFIGYTAGPSISRSWGVRRSASRPRIQRTSQTRAAPEPQTTGSVPSSPPPVIRYSESPPVKPSGPSATNMPPVQGLE